MTRQLGTARKGLLLAPRTPCGEFLPAARRGTIATDMEAAPCSGRTASGVASLGRLPLRGLATGARRKESIRGPEPASRLQALVADPERVLVAAPPPAGIAGGSGPEEDPPGAGEHSHEAGVFGSNCDEYTLGYRDQWFTVPCDWFLEYIVD